MQRDEEPQENLPDDLGVLGEELAASAAHLANVYPAPTFEAGRLIAPVEPAERAAPRRTALRFGIAIAGLACAVAVAVIAWQLADGFRVEPPDTNHVVAVAPDTNGSLPLSAPRPLEVTVPEMPQAVDVVPTVFHDLSAPELEGMLDLLEQQPAAATRLSI